MEYFMWYEIVTTWSTPLGLYFTPYGVLHMVKLEFPFYSIFSKCKLERCPYWTKPCSHWTCFGTNYPKNGVGLVLTLEKNFKFSKVLLSPKFNHNSMTLAVKKKNLYYISNLTFDRVNIPLQSMVNGVVENFFLHFKNDGIIIEFWGW